VVEDVEVRQRTAARLVELDELAARERAVEVIPIDMRDVCAGRIQEIHAAGTVPHRDVMDGQIWGAFHVDVVAVDVRPLLVSAWRRRVDDLAVLYRDVIGARHLHAVSIGIMDAPIAQDNVVVGNGDGVPVVDVEVQVLDDLPSWEE